MFQRGWEHCFSSLCRMVTMRQEHVHQLVPPAGIQIAPKQAETSLTTLQMTASKRTRFGGQSGFSMIEVLVTTSLLAVLTGMAVSNLRRTDNPAVNSSQEIITFFKSVRTRAMSSTSAYLISAETSRTLKTQYGVDCTTPTTYTDTSLTLTLPHGAELTDTTWSVCYSARGISDSNVTIEVVDQNGSTRSVEVLLGGAIREVS